MPQRAMMPSRVLPVSPIPQHSGTPVRRRSVSSPITQAAYEQQRYTSADRNPAPRYQGTDGIPTVNQVLTQGSAEMGTFQHQRADSRMPQVLLVPIAVPFQLCIADNRFNRG
jgi:hypothetical protein